MRLGYKSNTFSKASFAKSEQVRTGTDSSPVTVAPELFIQIGAMAVVISKWSFALDPMDDKSLHGFIETVENETSKNH